MCDLRILHRQFSGCHFLISFLKASNDDSFVNSQGTRFSGQEMKYFLFHKKNLHLANEIVKTVVNCNHYSLIEIIVSQ